MVTHPYLLPRSAHDGIREAVPSTSVSDVLCELLFLFVNTGFNALT